MSIQYTVPGFELMTVGTGVSSHIGQAKEEKKSNKNLRIEYFALLSENLHDTKINLIFSSKKFGFRVTVFFYLYLYLGKTSNFPIIFEKFHKG